MFGGRALTRLSSSSLVLKSGTNGLKLKNNVKSFNSKSSSTVSTFSSFSKSSRLPSAKSFDKEPLLKRSSFRWEGKSSSDHHESFNFSSRAFSSKLTHISSTKQQPLVPRAEFSSQSSNSQSNFLRYLLAILVAGGMIILSLEVAGDLVNPQTKKRKIREKVVILGSGFGGLSAAETLDTNRYDVSIVSPRNHFVFSPALISSIFGTMDIESITETIRDFFTRKNIDAQFYEAFCEEIDPQKKIISCKTLNGETFQLNYDKLVVAVGSKNKTYNIPGVEQNALLLNEGNDGRIIRNKIFSCFEQASLPHQTLETKQRLLNFVVAGSGPLAIQFLSELKEVLSSDLKSLYPELTKLVKVTVLDSGAEHHNVYEAKIRKYYEEENPKLKHNNVVPIGDVAKLEKSQIVLKNGEKLPYELCVWLTPLTPSPLVNKLRAKNPKVQVNENALVTNEYLGVKGFKDIYALGDCATMDQHAMRRKLTKLFQKLDENGDGVIDESEFQHLLLRYVRKYPQLEEYSNKVHQLFIEADINKDGKLQFSEFQSLLDKMDAKITSMPATAQVAQQQGRYLGTSLNLVLDEVAVRQLFKRLDLDKSGALDEKEIKEGLRQLKLPFTQQDVQRFLNSADTNQDGTVDETEFVNFVLGFQSQGKAKDWKHLAYSRIFPFRYKHLGGYEYVAYENKMTYRGSASKNIIDGYGAWWMWNSIYASKMLGWKIRTEMLTRYLLVRIKGRDFSPY